ARTCSGRMASSRAVRMMCRSFNAPGSYYDSPQPMKIGVQLLPQGVTWNQWRDGWLRIDELGFDSNWSFDHVHAPRGAPDSDSFEGWVGMAALAALTRNAWTGMLVSPITFRNPALLVKMATTLDHVSGGK